MLRFRQTTMESLTLFLIQSFLREGFAVDDFMKPDRVVIGTESSRAQEVLEELF